MAPVSVLEALVAEALVVPAPAVPVPAVPALALVIRRDPKAIVPGVPKRVAVRKDKTWSSG